MPKNLVLMALLLTIFQPVSIQQAGVHLTLHWANFVVLSFLIFTNISSCNGSPICEGWSLQYAVPKRVNTFAIDTGDCC